jgi:hypothetical protein
MAGKNVLPKVLDDGREGGVTGDGVDSFGSDDGAEVGVRVGATRSAVNALRQGADGAHVTELSQCGTEPPRPEEV